jgi:hypothetical protein
MLTTPLNQTLDNWIQLRSEYMKIEREGCNELTIYK